MRFSRQLIVRTGSFISLATSATEIGSLSSLSLFEELNRHAAFGFANFSDLHAKYSDSEIGNPAGKLGTGEGRPSLIVTVSEQFVTLSRGNLHKFCHDHQNHSSPASNCI
jgi:hypothetical protein